MFVILFTYFTHLCSESFDSFSILKIKQKRKELLNKKINVKWITQLTYMFSLVVNQQTGGEWVGWLSLL